jgi:hypothetical protein
LHSTKSSGTASTKSRQPVRIVHTPGERGVKSVENGHVDDDQREHVREEIDHIGLIEVPVLPSPRMDTPKIVSIKNTKPSDTTTTEPNKPVEVTTSAAKLSDSKTTEPSVEIVTPKDNKSSKKSDDKRRMISVAFPSKTVRQLKLLANVEGTSIASIVIASVTKTVAKRLPAALEALKSDLEG